MKQLIKILPIICLGLTPIIWFYGKGGVLINGIDTNFPLDPLAWFIRRFFVWNGTLNGGVDFSSSTAGMFFHLIQVIPFKLGLGLSSVELISLIFWFSLIVLSAYFYARIILPDSFLSSALLVVLYAFNTYLFNTWENVKVANLSLMAAIPAALAVIELLKEKRINYSTAALGAVLIGIILSGSGINPSYFFTFFLIIAIYFIAELVVEFKKKAIFSLLKNSLFFTSLVLAVNVFWILPTVFFVAGNVSPAGSLDKLGFTNWIDSLSEKTSLLNVLRLQGAWDWYIFDSITGLPVYIPYALNYFYNPPFIIFSFLLPALAILSLFFFSPKFRSGYLAFSLMILIGVFLGAGTHLPTGNFYRTLINQVPFFTVFRSPWYIFTPLLIISYAALISLLFYNLERLTSLSKLWLYKLFIFGAVSILIMGNLFYSYPLISGKIFRPERKDSFFVNFPAYVYESQQWLSQKNEGRIIGYPDDEIEQFNWGYRGIESILTLLASNEMLYSPLNAPDAPVAKLIKEFYQNLKKGQLDGAQQLAEKLNISLVFEKRDQRSLAPRLPQQIASLPEKNFGQWYFYRFPRQYLPKVYSVGELILGYPYLSGTQFISLLTKDELLINPDDNMVKLIPQLPTLVRHLIMADNSQFKESAGFSATDSQLSNRLLPRDLSKVNFDFEIVREGSYQPILERYGLEEMRLSTTIGKNIDLERDGKRESWQIDETTDSYIYFKPLILSKGKHQVTLSIDNSNLIVGGDFEGPPSFQARGKGQFTIEKGSLGSYLKILNIDQKAPEPSADFIASSFDPYATYFIELRYQQIYGNNASVVVFQNNQDTLVKAQTERLPNYPQMNTFSFFYEPVKTDSVLTISLIAPYIKDPLGTQVWYDNLKIHKVFTNRLSFLQTDQPVSLTTPKIVTRRVSPVLYEGEVDGGDGPHVIVFSENYSPTWELTVNNHSGSSIDISPIHFSANLYANAWYVEGAPAKYQIRIFNRHQSLLSWGLMISGLTITVVICYKLFEVLRKRRKVELNESKAN